MHLLLTYPAHMKQLFLVLLLSAASSTTLLAQNVGIGTTTPEPSAALDVTSTTQGVLLPRLSFSQRQALGTGSLAPPVAGLVIYQTDNTPGLYAYDGTAWVRLGADNLGNHTATQTLNLNAQRLLGIVSSSLGDSTAQVELNASVGTQSAALITRSNFGAKYTRAILSGYGKLPEGTTTANDFGIWATAYRSGGWAGFFSAGSTTTPLRWVGSCQNPGYNGTGSAIRIVDGTQGAGRVLTSNASGYGTWQPLTAAGGNFNLGPYYLVGNSGSTGIAITNAGRVGINISTPFSQLANTSTNIIGSDGQGGNPGSLAWSATQAGYVCMFYNGGTGGARNGLAVKVAGTDPGASVLDVSANASQNTAGTSLLSVRANGRVGIATNQPAAPLHIDGPESGNSSALGGLLSGGTNGNPSLELRGNGKTPYLDFAETSGVDYTTRLLSSGGVLNVYNRAGGTVMKVNGNLVVNSTTYTSDARFKTAVRPLSGALASVLALRGVRYEWNALGVQHGGTAGAEQVGVLAQELEQVYPELVATDAQGYKSVNYAQLTPVLLEALKEQQQQIEALKTQVATQATDHAGLQTLKEQLAKLQEAVVPSGQAQR